MNSEKLDIKKIKQFWQWFSENCEKFGPEFENSALLNELDDRITSLGDFTWEVGPGKTKSNALVISPNGDIEQLGKTKEIIRNAKECEEWEYFFAKPPKEWDLIFEFETASGDLMQIDASGWDYVLLKYEDGMFEIIVKAYSLRQLDEEDRQVIAEIVLDGVLGEEVRIQKICAIEVVNEFSPQYQNKSSNIKNVANHLKNIVT